MRKEWDYYLKMYNNRDLLSMLRCKKIMGEDGFWTGTALFRGDALGKACLGGVEAVLHTP